MTTPKYGHSHQRLRAQLLPRAYGKPCHFCNHPMLPGQQLDLDHTEDGHGYRGMTHSRCNRADGARKTNELRANPRSEDW